MKDKTNAEIDECGSGVGIGTWSYFTHSADRLFISSVLTGEIATVDNDLDDDLDEDGRRMYYPPIGRTSNCAFSLRYPSHPNILRRAQILSLAFEILFLQPLALVFLISQ